MQPTNATIKLVAGLDRGRVRRESGLFKAEGAKCVGDTLGCFRLEGLYATAAWIEAHPAESAAAGEALHAVAPKTIERMSSLTNAPEVIAVYRLPEEGEPSDAGSPEALVLALDGVQDPGNMGTIIRTAAWFGIRSILCSPDCADPYSPKAVMASMGAIGHVEVRRGPLAAIIAASGAPAAGLALDGENIYTATLPRYGFIVMGSEGHGISSEVGCLLTHRLRIPSVPSPGARPAESLNVGAATAVALAEFTRHKLEKL